MKVMLRDTEVVGTYLPQLATRYDLPGGGGGGQLVDFYDGGDHVHIWGLKFRKDEHIWGLRF